MTRFSRQQLLPFVALFGFGAFGCNSGGVGDPCTPEDEYQQTFNGFDDTEVNVESKSFQCETRVCIVNHFAGRVSCPYGQTEAQIASSPPTGADRCRVPGTNGKHCLNGVSTVACAPGQQNIDEITVPVQPQLLARNAQDTVYCSCRCKGPDANANYCQCPSGYECTELVKELGLPGRAQLAGSYCIKQGTAYDPKKTYSANVCDAADAKGHVPRDGYNVAEICGADGANPGYAQ